MTMPPRSVSALVLGVEKVVYGIRYRFRPSYSADLDAELEVKYSPKEAPISAYRHRNRKSRVANMTQKCQRPTQKWLCKFLARDLPFWERGKATRRSRGSFLTVVGFPRWGTRTNYTKVPSLFASNLESSFLCNTKTFQAAVRDTSCPIRVLFSQIDNGDWLTTFRTCMGFISFTWTATMVRDGSYGTSMLVCFSLVTPASNHPKSPGLNPSILPHPRQ